MTKSQDEKVDGARIAAQILMRLAPAAQERIVQAMNAAAPQALKKVQEKMVTIEDLSQLSAKSIQVLLREIDHRDLVNALAGASESVREAIYQSIPERKQKIIAEDISYARELSPAEVVSAQKRIVVKLDELKEKGKIVEDPDDGTWA
jgi:flagellar motor switch protein FliG